MKNLRGFGFQSILATAALVLASCSATPTTEQVVAGDSPDTQSETQSVAGSAGTDTGSDNETGTDTDTVAADEPAAAADQSESAEPVESDDSDPVASAAAAPEMPETSTTTDNADDAAPEPADLEPWSSDFGTGIAPILEDSCAQCHIPGAAGSQHFSLTTAGDAAARAAVIAAYVGSGEMPPWPSSDLSVPFHNELALTSAQVDAVVEWASSGAALDVDPDTPIVSSVPVATMSDPDMELAHTGGAYTGDPTNVDDYRCFIYDPELTEQSWLVGSEFVPDQTQIVHHGIIFMASRELRGQADFWDGADGQPGWPCYGLSGLQNTDGGFQFRIASWAPGAGVARQPEGYGIGMRPGDFVVAQIHYHYDGFSLADDSKMRLDFAEAAEIEAGGGVLKALNDEIYLTPAELPCYEGDTHPLCDRDAAVARSQELYGPLIGAMADTLLADCGQTPEDYAEMTNGTSTSVCDKRVRTPGTIYSIAPHMHELGLSYRMTLNPDTPEERILIDIPDWSFDWQFGYRPIEEIVVDRSDVLRIECSWNRERAPYEAVGWVIWADGTGDEMCYTSVLTKPNG